MTHETGQQSKQTAIILAAGKGTRMKSDKLKVLHKVAGKPIVSYVVESVLDLGFDEVLLVIGHQADEIKKEINHPKVKFVIQEEQLGTGHAVIQAKEHLTQDPTNQVMVLAGDCPLVKKETLSELINTHNETKAKATILTAVLEDAASYGRILRGENGGVTGIKEAKDCTPEELEINEINTAIYMFQEQELVESLSKISTNNKQGEYYLTDVIHILKEDGQPVSAYITDDPDQTIGVNTRMDLSMINKVIYQRHNLELMKNGVTIIDPDTTFIDQHVQIGQDTVINPFTIIQGKTTIGKHSNIGPNSVIIDATLDDHTSLPAFTKIGK